MRFRRHRPAGTLGKLLRAAVTRVSGLIDTRGSKRRRLVLAALVFLTPFLLGYVMAATVLFPAPFLANSQPVPRILGLAADDARRALQDRGLVSNQTDAISHPTAPRGEVVWQDPPPGVDVQQGTAITFSASRGPQPVPVPDVAGYDQATAERLVTAAGLEIASIISSQAPVPKGVVVNSRPPAGVTLVPGSGVILFVSVGAPTISVPDLTGLTLEEAREVLETAGLTLGSTPTRLSEEGAPGTVLSQVPGAGTLSAPGFAVDLTIRRENNDE